MAVAEPNRVIYPLPSAALVHIECSPAAGRYIVANREISPGESVLEEEPYAAVLNDASTPLRCDASFALPKPGAATSLIPLTILKNRLPSCPLFNLLLQVTNFFDAHFCIFKQCQVLCTRWASARTPACFACARDARSLSRICIV